MRPLPALILVALLALPASGAGAQTGSEPPLTDHTCTDFDSAVWAQELDLMSQRVVDALNEQLGRPAVKRLRCEVSAGRQ